jgi:hypothetical protein
MTGSVTRQHAPHSARGGRRRGLVALVAGAATVFGGLVWASIPAAAEGTNGDPIEWPQRPCYALGTLRQPQDLTTQTIVPNTVNQGEAYTADLPSGSTQLPSTGGGYTITGFKDIAQTFLFRSSSGMPAVTNAVANGGATNNGNPIAFNVSFTNEGTSVPISTASYSLLGGGTITYTTSVAHGLAKNQVVDILGNNKSGYNFSGARIVSVPTATTFTLTGRPLSATAATWSAADGGTITYTLTAPHDLKVGDRVTTYNFSPSRYNRTQNISAVPSPTQLVLPGGATDPGPATTLGTINTLPNPTAFTLPAGNVHTLTTVSAGPPTASPGELLTPSVTISLTAPMADATVTTYGAVVTTTAVLVGLGDAPTVCEIPHADPQTDGISATLVGAGGPTTSSYPTCRPPDVCATTTTTAAPTTTTTEAPTTTTTEAPTTTTTAIPAPTVTSVSPTSGSTAGGTSVTITGTNLTGATAVDFGTTAATGFTVDSDTQITATSPAHAAGTVHVTVTTPAGTSATSPADEFTFVTPAPAVTSVSPASGSTAGGTSVTITGTNLTGATAVDFGTTAATGFTVDSETQITATSPAHAAGTVHVTVTTPGGTSATSPADEFTFVTPAPVVTSVLPSSGSTAGGTSVMVTGSNFTGATAVDFGGTAATSFTVDSDSQISATSPAHAAGTVHITVTTPGGTSATSPADEFTYVAPAACTTLCVNIGDKSILETNAGTHTMTFPVTLSEPSASQVTVNYTVTAGTATGGTRADPGVDFKVKSGTLTFKPGLVSGVTPITKTIGVPIFFDLAVEGDETLTVTLSSPSAGLVLGRSVGTGTILDDDAAGGVTLGIGDGSIVVQRGGKQSLKMQVTLSAPLLNAVTFTYTKVPGTATHSLKATDGGDYGAKVTGTFTFLPGQTIKTVAMPIWADAVADPDETFTVVLSGVSGDPSVSLVRDTGTGTLFALN